MVRKRLTSLALLGSLALLAGCQTSMSERPLFQRLFGPRCTEACCPEDDCCVPICDGPLLPDAGPPTLTPPTPLATPNGSTPPPPPLRPQAQPQPYSPTQARARSN